MTDALLQDLRFAFRSLGQSKTSTAIAVLCLALGIGVNTMTFSGINGMMLRPLPFRDADRIVALTETRPRQGASLLSVGWHNLADWRAQTTAFEDVAVFRRASKNLSNPGDEPERVQAANVGANLFPMLGVQPVLGRHLHADEDRPGAPKVALIAHSLWT